MVKRKTKQLMTSIAMASALVASPTAIFANSVEEAKEIAPLESSDKTVLNQPDIIGQSGITIDYYTGEVLYAKNESEEKYPASITKVLTALLVAENLDMNDKITFSARAVSEEASNQQLLFQEGEQTTVKEALLALMIISSNDAAVALAEAVSGSVEDFSKLMNKKAKELGSKNSHFLTPNGLPNPEHVTTAADYAKIVKGAMEYPVILKLMGTREAIIKTNNREVEIKSPNSIPTSNPNSLGGKTGYTDSAQHTLVEVLEKDGRRVISVVFHSTKQGKYDDINTMSDYAFSLFNSTKLYSADEIFQIVEFNNKEYPLKVANDVIVSYPTGSDMEFVQSVEWDTSKKVFEPGETVATLIVKRDGETVSESPLVTDTAFEMTDVKGTVEKMANKTSDDSNNSSKVLMVIGAIFVVPLFVFGVLLFLTRKKKR